MLANRRAFRDALSNSGSLPKQTLNGVDSAGQGRYRGFMTDYASSQSYGVVYAPPPVGQPMHGPGTPAYAGVPPQPPRGPRNLLAIAGAVAGTAALVVSIIALVITVARSPSEAPAQSPSQPASKPFMFSTSADKQWCISMRPLLAESLEIATSAVMDNGPYGPEYQRFDSWVTGWADRMTSEMNGAAERGSANSWLDRSGRQKVDLTVGVKFIAHDQWWKSDAGDLYNRAASVGTSINAYCRSVGEPVNP